MQTAPGLKASIWRHLFQHLPPALHPAGAGGELGASPLLPHVWVVVRRRAHLPWHPASPLVPRAAGAGARGPFAGCFHPSCTRSPFLSVSGAPECVAEPAPAGAPQNTPLTSSRGGKTPRGRGRESGVTLVTGGRCVTSQGLIGAPVRAGTSVRAAVGAEERQAR